MARAYLDHASASPVRPEAVEAMLPWFGRMADPGRLHEEGAAVRVAVETARGAVAGLLGARSREVVLTASAAESLTTAVFMATGRGPRVVLAAVEQQAVRETAARAGDPVVVGVDRLGRVDATELLAAVDAAPTALVCVQLGNHEVGTLQPVAEVVAGCRERGVLVHVDATAAAGQVAVDFGALGADLLSVGASAMGGPPGVAALLVRRGLRLRPLLLGGAQERARRAGLEDVPAIVGWGAVAELLAGGGLTTECARSAGRTGRVVEAVADGRLGAGTELLGDPSPAGRLPHLVCLAPAGVEAEPVLLALDRAGVAVHSGSSCSSELLEPSPVLEAMGVDPSRSLRVSVGWSTTDADVDRLLAALPPILERFQAMGPAAQPPQ